MKMSVTKVLGGLVALWVALMALAWLTSSWREPQAAKTSQPIADAATPAASPPAAQPSTPAPTPAGPCVEIKGESQKDRQNLSEFCRKGIVKGSVVRAEAMQSLLWLYVTRDFANAMRADRMTAEQVIKTWMQGWRQTTGGNSVTVYVKWQDVDVATGQTSIFSGDQVTIR